MLLRHCAKRAVLTLLVVLATGGLGAGSAQATTSPDPVVNDCLNHRAGLAGHYTVAQLNHALQVMPAETKEYTSCPDVINRALLAAVKDMGSGGGGGGSSSFLPTPVIIVIVLLVLLAVTFGAAAVRRRRDPDGDLTRPGPPG